MEEPKIPQVFDSQKLLKDVLYIEEFCLWGGQEKWGPSKHSISPDCEARKRKPEIYNGSNMVI